MAITHEPQGDELERMAQALQKEKEATQQGSLPNAEELQPSATETDEEPEVIGMQASAAGLLETADDQSEDEGEVDDQDSEDQPEADEPPTLGAAKAKTPPTETPDIFEKRQEPPRGKKKTWKIIGAGVAVLSLLGVGGLIGRNSGSSNPREVAVEPVPEDLSPNTTGSVTVSMPETTPPPSVPGNTGTSTPETSVSAPTGGFNPGEIVRGEPTIEGKLPNGETVEAAELASIGEGPERVASTLFGLLEAYANTKDQNFLDAISTDPQVQSQIKADLEVIEGAALEAAGLDELPSYYTAKIFGNPDQQPKFAAAEYDNDSIILSLTNGDVRFNPYISASGQRPSPDDPSLQRTTYNPSFSVVQSESTVQVGRDPKTGKSRVENFHLKWKTPNGELDRDVNN